LSSPTRSRCSSILAAKDPERFETAAIPWHGLFEIETRAVGFAEAQVLLGALAALRDPAPQLGLETIVRLAERFRVQSVALQARRLSR
jgi:hypothetical protein